jgi:hypothetical protein
MFELRGLIATHEAEFKAGLGAEARDVEIPFFHFIGIGEGCPDAGRRRIVYTLDDYRSIHFFRFDVEGSF